MRRNIITGSFLLDMTINTTLTTNQLCQFLILINFLYSYAFRYIFSFFRHPHEWLNQNNQQP